MSVPRKPMVKKFGGTSVGSVERIEKVAELCRIAYEHQGEHPIVVVSAMSGETNRLVELAHQIDPSYRGPAYDTLLASGEQVSVGLLGIALQKRGLQCAPFLAHQMGLVTDAVPSKARIQHISQDKVQAAIALGQIPVIAGFQGVDEQGRTTTLGRGGSDTSAVAIAASLGLPDCEIFTDVPAVFSADPRLVPKARELRKLSFEEMMEMASLGSKVLHTRSVEIGAKYGVRIHLRSSFVARAGTWILPESEVMENLLVSSVTTDPNTIVFELAPVPVGAKFLSEVFIPLSEVGVSVDIISQSEISSSAQRMAFSIPLEDLAQTEKVLAKVVANKGIEIRKRDQVAKVSVVGVGMRNHPGVAATFFKTLAQANVQAHLVTTSEISISAVVDRENLHKVAVALHTAFGLDAAGTAL